MRWITRTDVKGDRVTCPWLIRPFVDPDPEFLFVPEHQLVEASLETGATPFDAPRIPEVKLNHRGDRFTFEAITEGFHLGDTALQKLVDRAGGRRERARTTSVGARRHDMILTLKFAYIRLPEEQKARGW